MCTLHTCHTHIMSTHYTSLLSYCAGLLGVGWMLWHVCFAAEWACLLVMVCVFCCMVSMFIGYGVCVLLHGKLIHGFCHPSPPPIFQMPMPLMSKPPTNLASTNASDIQAPDQYCKQQGLWWPSTPSILQTPMHLMSKPATPPPTNLANANVSDAQAPH